MAAPMCVRTSCRFQRLYLRQIACSMRSEARKKKYSTAADSKIKTTASSKATGIQLDPQVSEALTSKALKHKYHPGRLVLSTVTIPQRLQEAADVILEKYPVKELSRKADKLANYLWSRHAPVTDAHVNKVMSQVYQEMQEKKEKNKDSSPIEKEDVLREVRKEVYHWQPISYDAFKSLVYLTGHLAHNYSVLLHCFAEIFRRDPEFLPRSVYNLGSGLGTAIWAANSVWDSKVFEYYCVDSSQDMNTVARLLLQDGDSQKQMCIPGVAFRQFAPSASMNQFEVVVSAYTLLDHPGPQQERLEMVENLWNMTSDYLILVENGTTAGFSLIDEARNHLLQICESTQDDRQKGYIFAPCPHDNVCPKFAEKMQPCFSQVYYKPLLQNHTKSRKCHARYSYIIMRKGTRKGESSESWPRVIQDMVNAHKHTHCHLCCSDGKVRHMIFTSKKQGYDLYKCSRYTVWGDRFPVVFPAEE